MGRLLERLARAADRGGAGIGFGAASKAVRTLAVVARVPASEVEAASAAGADGVLVVDGIPAASGSGPALGSQAGTGGDFVLITPDADPSLLLAESADRVLVVDPQAQETDLRALAALECEVTLVTLAAGTPGVLDLGHLRRAMQVQGRPALVELAGVPDAQVLRLVRDLGAAGILVSLSGTDLAGVISAVEALPARPKPRRTGGDGVLAGVR